MFQEKLSVDGVPVFPALAVTVCWVISVERCVLLEGQQQNEGTRGKRCSIYRV